MQHGWILIYVVSLIVVVNARVKDLHVNVIPVQTRFASTQNVNVVLKYSNTGDEAMSIYEWVVPEKGLVDPIFEVTRDGEPVEYVGPVFKRRASTAEDVITLAPGATLSVVVQLSTAYNMTQSGNYVVQYKKTADQVVFTTNSMLRSVLMSSNEDKDFVLQSTPVTIFTAGHRNLLIEQANEYNSRTRVLTPTYSGCTSSQSTSIRSALNAAQNYANNAVQYLNSQSSGTSRYTTWFGTYSSSRQLTVKNHFTAIQSVLSSKAIAFDCTCPNGSPSTYAYVYRAQHYKIYLCNQFWPSSSTIDTQGGTIIHELAHFSIVANTDDHQYGQAGCRQLATTDPLKALMNSDSHQYFAENYPTNY